MNRSVMFAAMLLAMPGAGAPLLAQASSPAPSLGMGPSLGVHGTTAALSLDRDERPAFGGGLGVTAGYGFRNGLSLHSVTTGALMAPSGRDRYLLSHLDVEARYRLGGPSRALAPNLAIGASGRTARFEVPDAQGEGTVRRTVVGVTAGGGLNYHLSPSTALDWSIRHTFGDVSRWRCPDAADQVRTCSTTTRVNFGVAWYPLAR